MMPGGENGTNRSDRKDGQRHALLETAAFAQLHTNDIIEARPQILHFGGFQIHKEHLQRLHLLNISPSSLRLSIIGPSTPWFRITYDKKGLLAPGMSEDVTVIFSPHEWRYYHDSVKIFCGELAENLVVPIHAYPSANDIVLPRTIDFGKVAMGTSRKKVLPLSCKIPIRFEFDITVLEAHPDFDVAPLQGSIPPDGTVDVVIIFHPTRYWVARTELRFNISQFGFEPVNVALVGSCTPGLTREEVFRRVASEVDIDNVQTATYSRGYPLVRKQNREPIQIKQPKIQTASAERTVDGVKVPIRLGMHATNFVLNQTAGKLPLKDLSSFIRAERQRQKAESNRGRGNGTSDDTDGDNDDRQALELRFEMRYREVEARAKERELKCVVATGEDLLTDTDIERFCEKRARVLDRRVTKQIEKNVQRVDSVLSLKRVAVPTRYIPAVTPQWDEHENKIMSMRLQVIDRMARAGSKCLMQVRAKKRLQRLWRAIRQANVTDRASCRAWVESENKAVANGIAVRTDEVNVMDNITDDEERACNKGDKIFQIGPDFLLPIRFPTSQSFMCTEERRPVEVEPLDNFEEFKPFELRPRLDYKVHHYEEYTVPPPAAYMRPCNRPRLNAALEELSIRGPCGDIFDLAEEPLEMPESCLWPPQHDPLSLLVPSTECRTYIGLPKFAECDIEYRLSQPVPPMEPLKTPPLLPPNIMSFEEPWMCSWRRTRHIRDPFQDFDPFPASFAEGGGPTGPFAGSNPGGEYLSFLPVGGYKSDIPSDTDSDEREEFEMPPPSEEEYKTALEGLSTPVVSKVWQKEQYFEERLSESYSKRNRSVRDRLRELNKDLDYSNKLYLG